MKDMDRVIVLKEKTLILMHLMEEIKEEED